MNLFLESFGVLLRKVFSSLERIKKFYHSFFFPVILLLTLNVLIFWNLFWHEQGPSLILFPSLASCPKASGWRLVFILLIWSATSMQTKSQCVFCFGTFCTRPWICVFMRSTILASSVTEFMSLVPLAKIYCFLWARHYSRTWVYSTEQNDQSGNVVIPSRSLHSYGGISVQTQISSSRTGKPWPQANSGRLPVFVKNLGWNPAMLISLRIAWGDFVVETGPYGLQNLKYFLSGPLQKKCVGSCPKKRLKANKANR